VLREAHVEVLASRLTRGIRRHPSASTQKRTVVILNILAADDEEETEMESIADDRKDSADSFYTARTSDD